MSRVGRDHLQGYMFTAADLPAWHSRNFLDWSFIGRNSIISSLNTANFPLGQIYQARQITVLQLPRW